MISQFIFRNSLVAIALLFLLFLILRKKQTSRLNWSMFYSTLWVAISLPVINWACVALGFWTFSQAEDLQIFIPYDLLFVWVIVWGTVVPFLFKGSKVFFASVILFWIDVLYMPYLENFDIIRLGEYWLVGEVLLILFVFLPAFMWSKLCLRQTHVGIRSLFQFICMAVILCIDIPFITLIYVPHASNFQSGYASYIVQFAFIILLPSFIALMDLSEKGRGTPFPYDPTKALVRSGVYAYIRNPIQWSLTLFFVPLSILYNSPLLLVGMVVSVAYSIGISNPQEFESMEQRFGSEWVKYKNSVPAWLFLWIPADHPKGTIYFKKTCTPCSSVRGWFERRNPFNLEIKHAEEFKGEVLSQVRYVDYHGVESSSIKAISSALEHINLGWATLGWFMRLPGINFILQSIVDTMVFDEENDSCEREKPLKVES